MRLAALLALLALAPACLAAGRPGVHWDFEDGTLQGWRAISGNLAPQPSAQDNDRWQGHFGKQGTWFIGTCELADGSFDDGRTGELRSPSFLVRARWLSLLVGGGSQAEATCVALVRWRDGQELFRATGHNRERMEQVLWDLTPWRGERVYLRVVDGATGGWGHVNVDDIRELTPEEEAAVAKAAQEQKQALAKRVRAFKASLSAPSRRKVYQGESLTDLALPLGGIGAGSIALGGRGDLREWQIFNVANSACVVPGGFFAVRAQVGQGEPVARLLQLDGLAGLPSVAAIEYVGEYPLAELRYRDPALPVSVRLEAFSPFIPLNAKDSAIPGLVLNFTVKNTSSRPAQVSLLASCQNAVGYDGRSEIAGVASAGYGGNLNRVTRRPGWRGVEMTAPALDPQAKHFGSLVLGTTAPDASALAGWEEVGGLWREFTARGTFAGPAQAGPTPAGRTTNCAVAAPLTLQPGEQQTVTFLLTWHFPNHYADYDEKLAGQRIGNMYRNWFADAPAAAGYLAANLERLTAQTRLFRDTFYDSTLPYWFLDCISSQVSTLRSQTVMWIEDGTFAAFEGCSCCPMNCTHVWNYEQTLAKLFPDLERNMRDTDFGVQQDESGFVHHRTVLPLSLPRASGPFCDGHLGCIMKMYREYLQSPDERWLREKWPQVKRAMDWAMATYDPQGTGLIAGEQWNTYDIAVYGPNSFIAGLYLGALRAAEEMARGCGDTEAASRYRDRFEQARAANDSLLWNGEYYIQVYDDAKYVKHQYGQGCLSDQMLGQWLAHVTGLGYLLPQERVRQALQAVMKHNFRWDFTGFKQAPREFAGDGDMGLLCCTWPQGGRPEVPILYCDEAWTGIEYQVASHLIYEGMVPAAYQLVRAARNRYDGVARPPFKRNPWNEIECGEHYARAMSSWALLLAAQGYWYHGPEGILQLAPRITPERFRSFFSTAEGYGTFSQRREGRRQTDSIALRAGGLRLTTLVLEAGGEAGRVQVRGAGRVGYTTQWQGNRLTVRFAQPLLLEAGSRLAVTISG